MELVKEFFTFYVNLPTVIGALTGFAIYLSGRKDYPKTALVARFVAFAGPCTMLLMIQEHHVFGVESPMSRAAFSGIVANFVFSYGELGDLLLPPQKNTTELDIIYK